MMATTLFLIGLAAPPTLGDGLRAIDAFGPRGIEARFQPVKEPTRTGPRALIITGAAMVVGGLVGALLTAGCNTQDAEGRCLDARVGEDLYPSLAVIGLGLTMTGTYWFRRAGLEEAP